MRAIATAALSPEAVGIPSVLYKHYSALLTPCLSGVSLLSGSMYMAVFLRHLNSMPRFEVEIHSTTRNVWDKIVLKLWSKDDHTSQHKNANAKSNVPLLSKSPST